MSKTKQHLEKLSNETGHDGELDFLDNPDEAYDAKKTDDMAEKQAFVDADREYFDRDRDFP